MKNKKSTTNIKKSLKKDIYNTKIYWYHVSDTLDKRIERLIPWDYEKARNRSPEEPCGKRICVSPTIEQCITAIPYTLTSRFSIYRTKYKMMVQKPNNIFDANVTKEGWITTSTEFIKIGMIDFEVIEEAINGKHVISQAASVTEPKYSGRVLKWWKNIGVKRFIEKT